MSVLFEDCDKDWIHSLSAKDLSYESFYIVSECANYVKYKEDVLREREETLKRMMLQDFASICLQIYDHDFSFMSICRVRDSWKFMRKRTKMKVYLSAWKFFLNCAWF